MQKHAYVLWAFEDDKDKESGIMDVAWIKAKSWSLVKEGPYNGLLKVEYNPDKKGTQQSQDLPEYFWNGAFQEDTGTHAIAEVDARQVSYKLLVLLLIIIE